MTVSTGRESSNQAMIVTKVKGLLWTTSPPSTLPTSGDIQRTTIGVSSSPLFPASAYQALRTMIEHFRRLHLNRYKNHIDIHQIANQFSRLLFKFDQELTPSIRSSEFSTSSSSSPLDNSLSQRNSSNLSSATNLMTSATSTKFSLTGTEPSSVISTVRKPSPLANVTTFPRVPDSGTTGSSSSLEPSAKITTSTNEMSITQLAEMGSRLLVWLIENYDQLFSAHMSSTSSLTSMNNASTATIPIMDLPTFPSSSSSVSRQLANTIVSSMPTSSSRLATDLK